MTASRGYVSGLAPQLESFVRQRVARGCWCEGYDDRLHRFDRHCAGVDPSATTLTQEMVDGWFEKRDTETPESCYRRTLPSRSFVAFARERGLTEAAAPDPRHAKDPVPVPHAFTEDELARFFEACDSIDVSPFNRSASAIRKVTCPAFFRLLYSSGIRTTEARLLMRGDVDLEHGVLDIRRSKGHDQHYVALHGSMTSVLRDYDAVAERLQPGREWFFQSPRGGHYDRRWVGENFRALWGRANGDGDHVTAYMLQACASMDIRSMGDFQAAMREPMPPEERSRLREAMRLARALGHLPRERDRVDGRRAPYEERVGKRSKQATRPSDTARPHPASPGIAVEHEEAPTRDDTRHR